MLCPEVWNIKAPRHHFEYCKGHFKDKALPSTIKNHYFNNSVTFILPNTCSIPDSLIQSLTEDTGYYSITNLPVTQLINKEFIEAFVKTGELTLLTTGKKIDVDNFVAIIPSGILILSLLRETYQKLGIEGKPTFFERKDHSRFVVTIDLKDENLIPGKKKYERIHKNLSKLSLTFDVIVSWDPPEEKICPSSIASWFYKQEYSVGFSKQIIVQNLKNSISIPVLEDNLDFPKLFELVATMHNDFLNTCDYDAKQKNLSNSMKFQNSDVSYLKICGFLTATQIANIFNILKNYLSKTSTLPWCSFDVQGFYDSPVSWGLKEHTVYIDGDNSYMYILKSNNEYILRKSLSSNNKPRIKQK